MIETFDSRKEIEQESGDEVYTKIVRAGRRTYFFDVKATRNDDYFLTITESRKKQSKEGAFFFDKHKIYLYKEDFVKFSVGLEEVVNYIREHKPEFFVEEDRHTDYIGPRIHERPTIDEEFDRL